MGWWFESKVTRPFIDFKISMTPLDARNLSLAHKPTKSLSQLDLIL